MLGLHSSVETREFRQPKPGPPLQLRGMSRQCSRTSAHRAVVAGSIVAAGSLDVQDHDR